MSENTKLVRIESLVDGLLARLIQLPMPFTSLTLLAWSAACVAVGAIFL